MNLLRVISLAVALLPALACAQWLWVDKDGRKVFSDRSPPADIPAKNILRQPGIRPPPPQPEAEAPGAAASSPATVARLAASAPKISGKDKSLEEKKKLAEQEQETKKKAEEEKFASEKAQQCERAKRSLAAFNTGVRVRAPNAKGELDYLTDEQRAAETKRLQGIATECKS